MTCTMNLIEVILFDLKGGRLVHDASYQTSQCNAAFHWFYLINWKSQYVAWISHLTNPKWLDLEQKLLKLETPLKDPLHVNSQDVFLPLNIVMKKSYEES